MRSDITPLRKEERQRGPARASYLRCAPGRFKAARPYRRSASQAETQTRGAFQLIATSFSA
jgi:hypothetical protein